MSDTPLASSRAETASGSAWRAFSWKGWIGLILPVLLAVLLEWGVSVGWLEGRFTPPPSKIAATLGELIASGEWFRHALATGGRVALGFLFGAGAGIVLGTLSGAVPVIRRLIDPTIQALRAVPSIAWVPLFILWFGIFETSKITLIAVGVFFPVYLGVLGAVLSIDRKVIEVGRVFRLSKLETGRRILLPATLPALVTSLRAGLGLGWMFVVAAEIMGASEGLGFLLVDGQQVGRSDLIVSAILSFAFLGFLTDALLAAATRPFLRWRDDLSTTEKN
ncbi:MAG: ABC transporter permease [Methylobacterium sp.]|nr:ABC transporter permease [Methylobacterium sp.]MCA3656528.1 ABC transporter permease [Methylobacterium sp.]MCA3657831.1 ABC transporter permease [Methylobacterium sp.]MCA3659731.1 ABC transporter permease [Methylobacterium sp.]MCA3663990.1 ABC transporter permease [Methylobacterium sp.]